MNAEQAAHLLAHALRLSARHPRFRRDFTPPQRKELARLGCTPQQVERLQRILPAIARDAEAGPKLADVRTHLADAARKAHAAAASLRALLDAPECELARDEARLRMLEALLELHPERCERDAAKAATGSFGDHPRTRYDPRLDEARRLLAAIDDVAHAADHARERMRGAPQTRMQAHPDPVALIDAALNMDGPQVRPSESAASPFREIVRLCYGAARVKNADPQAAIRRYLKLNSRLEN